MKSVTGPGRAPRGRGAVRSPHPRSQHPVRDTHVRRTRIPYTQVSNHIRERQESIGIGVPVYSGQK
ncbi:hypothetical protein GCM10009654_51880 [Streptomyces hebeiensis]|uniref:Uncharacterized protein n=1 Tax=Streptomyces hebeiensis TaxID=229486 RepID=A0ABN1V0T3_9ACTN